MPRHDDEKRLASVKATKNTDTVSSSEIVVKKEKKQGLTFKEKREFETLSDEIEKLEYEKKLIETEMSHGILNNEELILKSHRHGEVVKLLDEKELRWLELSEK